MMKKQTVQLKAATHNNAAFIFNDFFPDPVRAKSFDSFNLPSNKRLKSEK